MQRRRETADKEEGDDLPDQVKPACTPVVAAYVHTVDVE
jgi:hypothetical protein